MYYRKNNGSKILSGILAVLLVLVIAAGVVGDLVVDLWRVHLFKRFGREDRAVKKNCRPLWTKTAKKWQAA